MQLNRQNVKKRTKKNGIPPKTWEHPLQWIPGGYSKLKKMERENCSKVSQHGYILTVIIQAKISQLQGVHKKNFRCEAGQKVIGQL